MALTRLGQRNYVAARITDQNNGEITPAVERAVLFMLIENNFSLEDNAESFFTPFLASELSPGKGWFVGKTLQQVLKALIEGMSGAPQAPNVAPTANAGPDVVLTLPTSFAQLSGTGADADGTVAAYLWQQVSGPVNASFSDPAVASPTVYGLTTAGMYVFSLITTDNEGAASPADTVTVAVMTGTQPAPDLEIFNEANAFLFTPGAGKTAADYGFEVGQ
jgi:hypothetical protein